MLSLGCPATKAQAKDEAAVKARLDQVANSFTANNAFMGTVLVVKDGKTLINSGYGSADLEWNVEEYSLGLIPEIFG